MSADGQDAPLVWVETATLADVDDVVQIEKLCYPHPWSRRQFLAALQGEASQRVIALRHAGRRGRVVGYVVLQLVVDELHVHNVAIDPGLQRRGLARRLLRIVLAWGGRRGARETWLEVRAGNEAALGLYASLGFQEAGRRRGYYSRPQEDAVVLRKGPPLHH